MIMYSKTMIHFINEIKSTIKTILSAEMHLKTTGNYFYNRQQQTTYPINVVIYNDKGALGYFNPDFYELGFHERLMYVSKKQLHNIIRHELAHYVCFINHGMPSQPHSTEFRDFCRRMGWSQDVYNASIVLEEVRQGDLVEEAAVFRKVKKLMALATSSNPNEAEQAMIKSRELLLKYNIDSQYVGSDDEEKVFLKRIMKMKRAGSKMLAISRILKTFFVSIVYNRVKPFVYLEIIGSEVNVQIAEYVAGVLDRELDQLWNMTKRSSGLSGLVAKNSFFQGVARGYCDKIQSFKKEYTSDVTQALMVIEKKLTDATSMIYGKLGSMKSHANHCGKSSALGEKAGQKLNINPSISQSREKSEALIGYFV
jgi:hypothetical protein